MALLRRRGDARQAGWALVAVTILLMLAWLALVLLVDAVRFVVLNPRAKTGFELFLAFGQLFGAFVLALVPAKPMAGRMRWVASGFFALGIGALGFGYLYPSVADAPHLNAMLYSSLYVRTVGTVLIAIGLASTAVPRIGRGLALALATVISLIGIALVAMADTFPPLVRVAGMASVVDHDPDIHAEALVAHAHLADCRLCAGAMYCAARSLAIMAAAIGGKARCTVQVT